MYSDIIAIECTIFGLSELTKIGDIGGVQVSNFHFLWLQSQA